MKLTQQTLNHPSHVNLMGNPCMEDPFTTFKALKHYLFPTYVNGVWFRNYSFFVDQREFITILQKESYSLIAAPKKHYQIFVPKVLSNNLQYLSVENDCENVVKAMESLSCGASSSSALDKENKWNFPTTCDRSSSLDTDGGNRTRIKYFTTTGEFVDAVVQAIKGKNQLVRYTPIASEVKKFGNTTLPLDPEGKSFDIVCSIHPDVETEGFTLITY